MAVSGLHQEGPWVTLFTIFIKSVVCFNNMKTVVQLLMAPSDELVKNAELFLVCLGSKDI